MKARRIETLCGPPRGFYRRWRREQPRQPWVSRLSELVGYAEDVRLALTAQAVDPVERLLRARPSE